MGKRNRLRPLVRELARLHPQIEDPEAAIRSGRVVVDGRVATNPATFVRAGASVVLAGETALRGEAKLAAALSAFDMEVQDRVALDVGAAAGGFTRVLLAAGARRVYAVEAGHGQLLGSLRQDRHVVNLEATNLGELDRTLVPDEIDVVAIDLSYLSLADAVPQLERVAIAAGADALALVKPQFELGLPRPPSDAATLGQAVAHAVQGFSSGPWIVAGVVESPVRGRRGTREFLLHARRAAS